LPLEKEVIDVRKIGGLAANFPHIDKRKLLFVGSVQAGGR
jgi:hypothetical protein